MSSKKSDVRQKLTYQRKCLKIRLWRERATARPFLYSKACETLPTCDYCDGLILYPDSCVMHEWLIKRGALPVDMQHLIMHEYNCVLAHNDCHDKHGQTKEFMLRCAKAQYERYGRDTIKTWVCSLMLRQLIWLPTLEQMDE